MKGNGLDVPGGASCGADLAAREEAINQAVGLRIRRERLAQGLTQSELGDQLNLSFQQVQKYERGINRVSAGKLVLLADLFNLPVQALFPPATTPVVPGQGPGAAMEEPELSRDALKLLRYFSRIESAALRDAVVALARQLSQADGDDEAGS